MAKNKKKGDKMKEKINELKNFIKEIRKLNNKYAKKFDYKITATITFLITDKNKETEITENVFRIDLKNMKLLFPTIVYSSKFPDKKVIRRLIDESEEKQYLDIKNLLKNIIFYSFLQESLLD